MLTIDGYLIDVAISEVHTNQSEVSSHPLESGSEIVDHVRRLPRSITVEGVVSNTPFGTLRDKREEFIVVDGETFALPSDEAYARLKSIQAGAKAVTIETDVERYENMVLTNLTRPENRSTGDAFRFTATFVEVLIVQTERKTVSIPRAKGKRNLGNRPTKPVDDPPSQPVNKLHRQLHERKRPHKINLCGYPLEAH